MSRKNEATLTTQNSTFLCEFLSRKYEMIMEICSRQFISLILKYIKYFLDHLVVKNGGSESDAWEYLKIEKKI